MTKKAEPVSEPKTRLLQVFGTGKDEEFQIEVPIDSKVTFGPAYPGKNDINRSSHGYALRVYNGPTEASGLAAVFTDVRQFRDTKIPVRKLVVRESGKAVWKSDDEGFSIQEEVKREKNYQDLTTLKRLTD